MRMERKRDRDIEASEGFLHLVEYAAPVQVIAFGQLQALCLLLDLLHRSAEVLRGDGKFYGDITLEVFPINEGGSGVVFDTCNPGKRYNTAARQDDGNGSYLFGLLSVLLRETHL